MSAEKRIRNVLVQLQERLDPHRDAVLWGEVVALIQAMTTGPLDATETASREVEKLRAENAALIASMQQLLEQPPAAYMRSYMGSMDFIVHEPWCIDGLSPGWVPLYQRPAAAAGTLLSCVAKQPSKDATDDR